MAGQMNLFPHMSSEFGQFQGCSGMLGKHADAHTSSQQGVQSTASRETPADVQDGAGLHCSSLTAVWARQKAVVADKTAFFFTEGYPLLAPNHTPCHKPRLQNQHITFHMVTISRFSDKSSNSGLVTSDKLP